jgi:hypothetical protein
MAKYKPAGNSKKREPVSQTRGLLPCAFIVIAGIALVSALFYFSLQNAGK